MSYTYLINPKHTLCEHYIPDDLFETCIPFIEPCDSHKRSLRKEAATQVMQLFNYALEQKISLIGVSGYRSYARQKELFDASTTGEVAPPGTSEHQSGLALDVSCLELNGALDVAFAETASGKWLKAHAPLYGFIIRYPKDKEAITGYPYEPWHIRYVTKPLSLYLTLTGLTLEEYHDM